MPEDPNTDFALLKKLLTTQHLAVLATAQGGHPYTSLVAFVASEDMRHLAFVTGRATTKYRNMIETPDVSLLIDSRTHSVEDFTAGAAVTVLGRVTETVDKESSVLLAAFLRKHPQLESFVQAPTTALCDMDVHRYVLVTRFQHVVDMKVGEWLSSNPL